MQRIDSVLCFRVEVGTSIEQKREDEERSIKGGQVKGCESFFIRDIGVRFVLHQQVDTFPVTEAS
jgi:hypothetical protein